MSSIRLNVGGGESILVESVQIIEEVNRIPRMRVTLLDANTDLFKQNKTLNIQINESYRFTGILTAKNKKIQSNKVRFEIEAKNEAVKMTLARHSKVYDKAQERATLDTLIKQYGFTLIENQNNLPVLHEQLVQHYCSDWDFLVSRAEANGCLVVVEDRNIQLVNVDAGIPGQVATLEANKVLCFEINALLHNSIQLATASAYNREQIVEPLPPAQAQPGANIQHQLGVLAHKSNEHLFTGIFPEQNEIQKWSNNRLARNALNQVKGRITYRGNPSLKLLNLLQVQGIDEISGTTRVSKIVRNIRHDGFYTDIYFGLDETPFLDKNRVQAPPASGLLPGISGIHIGVIELRQPDTTQGEGSDRVRVRLHSLGKDIKTSVVWARCSFPFAGENRGVFFPPKPGDEVVVGFFNDDPRHAVILGAMHTYRKLKPALEKGKDFTVNAQENVYSGIVTDSGLKLVFSDQQNQESIRLSTPEMPAQDSEKNLLVLDNTEGNGVEIKNKVTEKNQNIIRLNSKGVAIKYTDGDEGNDKGSHVHLSKQKIVLNKGGEQATSITLSDQSIEMAVKNSLLKLSDNKFEITINNQTLTLDANGIQLNSQSKISVKAGENVVIEGLSGIDLN